MTNTILATRNEAWGFFGTIGGHADANSAWGAAMTAIATATGCDESETREFLDSRHGRHFADDVANNLMGGQGLEAAVAGATARWMGWKISKRTSRETGIPAGLAYLTGFVIDGAIAADAA